jgi:hypothetical protein
MKFANVQNMSEEEKQIFFKNYRQSIRNKLSKLSEAQNHRCCYCGCQTWLFEKPSNMSNNQCATLEHVVAKCHGGNNHKNNLVVACSGCNNLRSNFYDAYEFYNFISENGVIAYKKILKMFKDNNDKKRELNHQNREKQMIFNLAILFTLCKNMSG